MKMAKKGWRRESKRHSLAARGFKSSKQAVSPAKWNSRPSLGDRREFFSGLRAKSKKMSDEIFDGKKWVAYDKFKKTAKKKFWVENVMSREPENLYVYAANKKEARKIAVKKWGKRMKREYGYKDPFKIWGEGEYS